MARRSTGGVVIDTRRTSPVFALRFRAYGRRQFVTLGSAEEGWSRDRAEQQLRYVLADVERGIWKPPDRQPAPAPELPKDPTFHEFASEWYRDNEGKWRERTRLDYTWQLTHHLLPFFAEHRLSQITAREIDRYTAAKVREGVLSATSINKTVTRLGQILKRAKRWGLIGHNPVEDCERLKTAKPAPVWLDRAEHIAALLDAAGELDREARRDRRHVPRRALLATLVFAGLRIGELTGLRWRDVDLTAGRIHVRASKTDAGVRTVDMLPVLRDELLALKAAARHAEPNRLVFPTTTGEAHGPSNIRRRVLAPAVERANERLEEAGDVPLPDGLTPHKLRHTFASLLVALGVDPGSVMDQLGHTDPSFTLRVYRHGMRRDAASRDALRQLVGLTDWAAMGSSADFGASLNGDVHAPETKNPAVSGAFEDGHGWARTSDLSRVKRALSH
jgi:integrase